MTVALVVWACMGVVLCRLMDVGVPVPVSESKTLLLSSARSVAAVHMFGKAEDSNTDRQVGSPMASD